jgi:restriction endonuclease Mrr
LGCLYLVVLIALIGLIKSDADHGDYTVLSIVLGLMLVLVCFWVYRLRRRRLRVKTLEQLCSLTPIEFEYAVADLLHDLGYRDVQCVGGAGDLAADITCLDSEGRTVVVQCKRYTSGARIGSPSIQHFIGMQSIHHQAERGMFVTTSSFTWAAIELANHHGIMLVDGAELSKLMQQVHA